MALFTVRSSPALTRLCIAFSAAIALVFLLTFSSTSSLVNRRPSLKVPESEHSRSSRQAESGLNKLIREKANELRKAIAVDKTQSLDPMNPESVWLLFNDEQEGYLNASTQNLLLRGLSHMQVQDVATNDKHRDSSISFLTETLILTGSYVIRHKKDSETIDDRGKFHIRIGKWYSAWSAKAQPAFNISALQVSELAIKSQLENVTYSFSSDIYGTKLPAKLDKVLHEIAEVVVEKVRKEVDDKLYLVTEKIVKVLPFTPKLFSAEDIVSKLNEYHSRSKRQVPCERGEELDEYVDSLFRFASRLIRAMEPFAGLVPNVTVEIPEFNLIIFLHGGGASHAYTIQRKKPAWVLCSNESISLGLTLGFDQLRVMYKFRVIQDWKLLFDGELEAQINKPKIQVQFTQTTPDEDSEEQVQQRVDALRIWSLGQIRVMLKGLGNLTQAMSIFLTGFVNRNIQNLMPSLRSAEDQAITFANEMLKNISIPFFSII